MEGNLSGPFVAKRLERHFPIARDTALHSSKDLAVSPRGLPRGLIPCGMPCAFAQRRLCSHLYCPLRAINRGYLLPLCSIAAANARTFLPAVCTAELPSGTLLILYHNFLPYGNTLCFGKTRWHFKHIARGDTGAIGARVC